MRIRLTLLCVAPIAATLAATPAAAQSAMLTLPDVSQQARVAQRIGLTDITVVYHRPLVAGRRIFGGVVPYGEVWRAGANANTTVEVTDPVTVEGHALARGIYGLHMIPGERSWIVIFSRNHTSWGSFSYDSTEDALRVTVVPRSIAPREVLTYAFDDPTPRSVVLTMQWDRTAVPLHIDIDTPHLVAQSLRDQLRGRAGAEWPAWEEVANFLLQNSLDAGEALRDADQSIAIEDRFENEITRARALTALGRTADASAAQARALSLGNQRQVYEFGRSLQRLGQQGAALQVYRDDARKHPGTWISHQEAARIAVGAGDYDAAAREIALALGSAPAGERATIADLQRQIAERVDINR
jgi:hypothetical protein